MIRPLRFVVLIVMLSLSARAFAQTGPLLLIRPMPDDTNFETFNAASVFADSETDNGDADFSLGIYESFGRVTESPDQFLPRLGYNFVGFDIHTDDAVLPERLFDMAIAAGFKLPDVSDFTGGLTIGAGYAGDRPFGDANAWYYKATAVFGKKINETDDVAILLDYDGNRTFMPDVPIPGLIFRRKVSDTLLLAAGFPVSSIEWKPIDYLTLELVYTVVDRLDVRADYEFIDGWSVFGLFERRRDAFHIDGLDAGNHDRLIFEQRKLEAGLRWEPSEDIAGTLSVGYAFGQEFGVGFDSRDIDAIAEIDDAPYVRLGFEARF